MMMNFLYLFTHSGNLIVLLDTYLSSDIFNVAFLTPYRGLILDSESNFIIFYFGRHFDDHLNTTKYISLNCNSSFFNSFV